MPRKILFFFTSSYPYGKGESFIENEISLLAGYFDKIIIVANTRGEERRKIPENTSLEYFPYELSFSDKIKALKNFFNSLYFKEKEIIKNTYKLPFTKIIRNILLTSLYKAEKLYNFYKKMHHKYVNKGDLVYLYSYWMNDMAVGCAYIKSKNLQCKFIARAHGWDVYFDRNKPPYLPLRHFISENADKLCFVSAHGVNYFKQTTGLFDRSHLIVSYLGTHKPSVEGSYKRHADNFRVVSCSSVIPLKRIDLIAQSLSKITDKNIEWTHLGGGVGVTALEQYLKDIFKNGNVKYHITGSLKNEDIMSFYSEHHFDLFINASTSEGLPVSIMEALSFGIPAIAPDVGGIKEIINHSINGYTFDVNAKPDDIALIIRDIINMPDDSYLTMRANAYKEWNDNFNAEKNYKLFLKFFE